MPLMGVAGPKPLLPPARSQGAEQGMWAREWSKGAMAWDVVPQAAAWLPNKCQPILLFNKDF